MNNDSIEQDRVRIFNKDLEPGRVSSTPGNPTTHAYMYSALVTTTKTSKICSVFVKKNF